MSTRHTGSRFARHLEKNCNLVNSAGTKMLPIQLDSIDSRRFVCLDVDPSYRKSICATRRKICNLVNREGQKCCRFDSIRSIRDDSSALMSTRHTEVDLRKSIPIMLINLAGTTAFRDSRTKVTATLFVVNYYNMSRWFN